MIQSIKTLDPFDDPAEGHILTKAIIDTIQDPLIVLDEKLRVITASKSFYKKFKADPKETQNKMFYDLGNGQWNIPTLRVLLEKVIPRKVIVENYKVSQSFPGLGLRIMLLNARVIHYENDRKKMLISIFDITKEQRLKHENENLSKQKDILLQEMRHRIANSLQIIASILLLKAQSVTSEETRLQLEDVHNRIMSIATVQNHLDAAGVDNKVNISSYLNTLCQSLAKSMIGERRPLSISVNAGPGKATTDEAIGLGLITTELVINALKHAFPHEDTKGQVIVTYKATKSAWNLMIVDDGIDMSRDELANRKGLGSGIIDSLTKQLNATVKTKSGPNGTIVSITHKK